MHHVLSSPQDQATLSLRRRQLAELNDLVLVRFSECLRLRRRFWHSQSLVDSWDEASLQSRLLCFTLRFTIWQEVGTFTCVDPVVFALYFHIRRRLLLWVIQDAVLVKYVPKISFKNAVLYLKFLHQLVEHIPHDSVFCICFGELSAGLSFVCQAEPSSPFLACFLVVFVR